MIGIKVVGTKSKIKSEDIRDQFIRSNNIFQIRVKKGINDNVESLWYNINIIIKTLEKIQSYLSLLLEKRQILNKEEEMKKKDDEEEGGEEEGGEEDEDSEGKEEGKEEKEEKSKIKILISKYKEAISVRYQYIRGIVRKWCIGKINSLGAFIIAIADKRHLSFQKRLLDARLSMIVEATNAEDIEKRIHDVRDSIKYYEELVNNISSMHDKVTGFMDVSKLSKKPFIGFYGMIKDQAKHPNDININALGDRIDKFSEKYHLVFSELSKSLREFHETILDDRLLALLNLYKENYKLSINDLNMIKSIRISYKKHLQKFARIFLTDVDELLS